MSQPLNVGIYIFEDMTMLDGYAPLQILSSNNSIPSPLAKMAKH